LHILYNCLNCERLTELGQNFLLKCINYSELLTQIAYCPGDYCHYSFIILLLLLLKILSTPRIMFTFLYVFVGVKVEKIKLTLSSRHCVEAVLANVC